MSYADDEFWERYKEFASESFERHQLVFNMMGPRLQKDDVVLDLGCGRCCIGGTVLPEETRYVATDIELPRLEDIERVCVRVAELDYRDHEKLQKTIDYWKPAHVMSWFSTDVVLHPKEARALYRRCLENEGVKTVFTAGFYYDDHRREDLAVRETGGLISYQVPRGFYGLNEDLDIFRVELPAPSKMFGETVVEVFTLLSRK